MTQTQAQATPPTVLSGVYDGGGDYTGVASFGTWRNSAATVAVDFMDHSTWSTLSDPTWLARQWSKSNARLSLAVPMLPTSGGSMSTGASGGYNGYFKTLAERLVANGQADAIIRLGWEMNGTWYSWSAVNSPTNYKSYWVQVVKTMRAVSGQKFLFEWAPNSGYGKWGFNVESAYPGDAYVDVIGASLYDQSWTYAPSQSTERWNEMLTTPYGLNWLASFSTAHNKPIAFAEWGLSDRTDGHGGGDDTHYIQQFYNWVKSHDVLYETYFNFDMGSQERHAITTGIFPNAAKLYQKLWGGGTTTSTTTETVTADAPLTSTSSSEIQVSWYSDRHDAKPLNGMKVGDRIYMFANVGSAKQVAFYLDDPQRSRTPTHVEYTAPWDFVGGSSQAALPFDTAKLASGTHTLTVVTTTSTGATKTNTATFVR